MKKISVILNKLLTHDRLNYLIIILYTIILILITLGFNNLYGSVQDWLSQHSTIPEYFRMIFYETGRLGTNFAFHLGGGQNIYNYSYYGLFSPVFLVSYLLPFIDMTTYTILSSIVLYILTGLLFYKFLRDCKFDRGLCLFLSLVIVTISPINFHFHHHIMFVSYFPFLILALLGINKYVNERKSLLLVSSAFLVIMTNYYYSVCSLLVILIYGIYKIIEHGDKNIIKKIFFLGIRLFISVLMSGVLLIPTAYTILNSERGISSNVNFIDLIKPNFSGLLYSNYTVGITSIFLVAVIGIIFSKKVKKSDLFLAIGVIIFTICPLTTYLLNGGLYIRGKVLIPFIIIYLVILGKFICYLFKNMINFKSLIIISIITCLIMFVIGYDKIDYYIIDLLLCLVLTYGGLKFKNNAIIYIPTLIIIFSITIGINTSESYVSLDYYNNVFDEDITSIINDINEEDKDFYRTVNENVPKENANKIYNSNYYTTTMYSSVYNEMYLDFYNKFNNIRYRNFLIQAGGENSIFNSLMGVRYIISKDDIPYYELIRNEKGVKVYYNKYAYPIVYIALNIGSNEIYDELDFPYNIEYMLNNTVVSSDNINHYDSSISEYVSSNIKDSYEFEINEDTNYNFNLEESIKNKILFISFDMDYNQSCSKGDQTISINGVVNKLTCSSWLYHNGNNRFKYVISNNDEISNLSINVSAGKYKIFNIKMYVMDNDFNENYQVINNLSINVSSSEIVGNATIDSDTYIVTSIPYDDGFKAYIDDDEVDCEVVNESFLGFKVSKGDHKFRIKYTSPWYNAGVFVSAIGFLIFIFMIIIEQKLLEND